MRNFIYTIIIGKRKGPVSLVVRTFLLLFSIIYGFVQRMITLAYDRHWLRIRVLPKPVVSIGNITWGGVGKTPIVLAIAQELVKRGFKPAVLLRGYMADNSGAVESDEAALLKSRLPGVAVLVAKNRWQAAQKFLRNSTADIFLLDDGFQHRRLHRDLDIVAIDSTKPFGTGRVIPAGILREPLAALSRADFFVLTKTDLGKNNLPGIRDQLAKSNPLAFQAETIHAPAELAELQTGSKLALAVFNNKKVACLSGIGNPEGFHATLKNLGVNLVKNFVFTDHHIYTAEDVGAIFKECHEQRISLLVTTEKDAVKLRPLTAAMSQDVQFLVLKIQIEFLQGKDELFGRIFSLLSR